MTKKWILGKHILVNGNCSNLEDMELLMGDEKCVLLLTDPPYNNQNPKGCQRHAVTKQMKTGKEAHQDNRMIFFNCFSRDCYFMRILTECFASVFNYVQPGAAVYCFTSDKYFGMIDMLMDGFKTPLRNHIVWVKKSLIPGWSDWQMQSELIFYGCYQPPLNNGQRVVNYKNIKNNKNNASAPVDRTISNVWQVQSGEKVKAGHPTAKPVDLLVIPIKQNTFEGDIVLDPFGGGGSTLIACERCNRKARLIEIDPYYCDVIISEFIKETGQKAYLVNENNELEEYLPAIEHDN